VLQRGEEIMSRVVLSTEDLEWGEEEEEIAEKSRCSACQEEASMDQSDTYCTWLENSQ
jgi:hypothetical protein